MPEIFHIVPEAQHNALIQAAYQHRGFHADESSAVFGCPPGAPATHWLPSGNEKTRRFQRV